ncbi:MAG: hypothetical protein PUC39_10420 [Lachnospiraceae bacterium]|nr:hypothetical protein [Lachnospiraceae bacterium]
MAEKSVGHEYKPVKRGVYITASLIANFILGVLGLGIGFVFFISAVVSTGSIGLNILVFVCGAVVIVIYLYLILQANRFLVRLCSNKKSKRIDKNRLFWSMLYFVCIFVISFAYSFLRAAIAVNLVS